MSAGRRHAWLISLGLLAVGSLLAHGLAYRTVEPHHGARHDLLAATGHGYLEPELLLSLGAALALVGFAGRALAGVTAGRGPSLWLFALVPPAGFAVQEHAERFLHHEALAMYALEPAFLVGLALQLPFAVASYLATRALLAAAGALARCIGARPRPGLAPDTSVAAAGPGLLPRGRVLVGVRGQRAPPALLCP